MASTTIHHPIKKEQVTCWADNEELAMVTSGNLLDEYVLFDPSDFLEDPQSPSMLLDSLDDSLNNRSNDQDIHPVQSFAGVDPIFLQNATSSAQKRRTIRRVPGLADTATGGASISDSELLRLEGISLRSPRANIAAPSSPPLPSTSLAFSPSKRSRILDTDCVLVPRAREHPKPQKTQTSAPAMEVFGRDPKIRDQKENPAYNFAADEVFDTNLMPIDSNGLPLSPPLTGRISTSGSLSNNTQFVTGDFEDPFCDGLPGSIATVQLPAKGLSTPINTPSMKDEGLYQNGIQIVSSNNTHIRCAKQRNTSSVEWPMEGIILSDDSQRWSSSSYIPGDCTMNSQGWWEDTDYYRQLNDENSGPSNNKNENALSSPSSSVLNGGAGTGSSIDMGMHSQQGERPYDYASTADDISGLMIHMPQPRQPRAAVLAGNISDQLLTTPTQPLASSFPNRGHHTEHHQQQQQQQQQQHQCHYQHRRPQPRAPSSGARHHLRGYHSQGSLTSPRRQAPPHHSSSRCMLARREESASPSPSSGGTLRRRASSISVRKQRSWSSRCGEPRTPRAADSGGSFGSVGSVDVAGGGGGGVDFVNFTPSDKNILMTGVAPSGSSKTKARREKEALERRKKLSEAAVKAVKAAGGDVERLARDGLLL